MLNMQNPEIDVDDIMRVLAYESSANPQTLGPAGIDFTEKRCREVAASAHRSSAAICMPVPNTIGGSPSGGTRSWHQP